MRKSNLTVCNVFLQTEEKELFKRIYFPLFTGESTKFDRLEHRKSKPIERRQPIKMLVKTAYKQNLAEKWRYSMLR